MNVAIHTSGYGVTLIVTTWTTLCPWTNRGKSSKVYYHSETKKLRQCNADPVLKTEPLNSARMPL
ncbi:hypothetical protein V3C99_005485, partial [Haemonchus contortus]